jgi:hypothetical protein
MMRTAKCRTLKLYEVQCPFCKECIGSPFTGSHIWEPGEGQLKDSLVKCESCGESMFIPWAVKKAYFAERGANHE